MRRPKIITVFQLVIALSVLWQTSKFALRPEARDALRRADALFALGYYYDSLAAYQALALREPQFAPVFLRLGILHTIRHELPAASQVLGSAFGLGLSGHDNDLVRLYQGQISFANGMLDEATQFWRLIGAHSPFYPFAQTLEAERRLHDQDYAAAEALYRAADGLHLSPPWRSVVTLRLAMLRASSDPMGALSELQQSADADEMTVEVYPLVGVFTDPLLPRPLLDREQLRIALTAESEQRAQLLGQLYLQAGVYGLAEAQFSRIRGDMPLGVSAQAYAAYARWKAGDRIEGLRRLEALVAAHPADPRARALLALVYLAANRQEQAEAELETLHLLTPRSPNTHLVWGQWYAAQHDYLEAAAAYRRALDDAAPEERGNYALVLARFHLDTSLNICKDGRPAAEEAAQRLPDEPQAWLVVAASALSCDDPTGARAAANRALQLRPDSAEAFYYLGGAFALLGDRSGAKQAFVRAADLAPASVWRTRAETWLMELKR